MIRFEWDPAKARANNRKHGVSFDVARHVFNDRDALMEHDRIEGGERRWQTLGVVGDVLLLLVAHTIRFENEGFEEDESNPERVKSFGSSRPAVRTARRDSVMKKNAKRVATGRPLSAQQLKEIAAIAAMKDEDINYSDIPCLPESFWKNAVRNPFYRPVKRQVTVRLDADIVAWLRVQGRGYQTRLNNLLRNAMLENVGTKQNGKG